ncbi:hypothetical protein [Methylorubrum sp. SB2]|uniref:hypothetical protein n=1 Tax=Methylorubrum subtropicum TaxID=3138812 RepID=UPI00313C20A4
MVAHPDLTHSAPLSAIADKAARALIQVRRGPGLDARVTLPVLYPSGSCVGLRIGGGGKGFMITDDGGACAEADMAGASEFFHRAARETAERCGVRFDGHEMFEIEAPSEALPGFMAIVADASRRAAQLVAERQAERLDRRFRTGLADRLISVFGSDRVDIRPQVSGASTHAWLFDAAARLGERTVLFAAVTPSAVSVSSAYLKLDDVARLPGAPDTVAVLSRHSLFRQDQRLILGRTARIIDATASDEAFRRIAA